MIKVFDAKSNKKNEILFGLLAIKGLGEAIVDKIVANRPYTSLEDFVAKVPDKKAAITLIKAGANVDQVNDYLTTAVMASARHGNKKNTWKAKKILWWIKKTLK